GRGTRRQARWIAALGDHSVCEPVVRTAECAATGVAGPGDRRSELRSLYRVRVVESTGAGRDHRPRLAAAEPALPLRRARRYRRCARLAGVAARPAATVAAGDLRGAARRPLANRLERRTG